MKDEEVLVMAKVTRPPGATAPVIATQKKVLHTDTHERALREAAERTIRQQSLTTAALRKLPSNQDGIEIQVFILRKEGWHYGDICRVLDVGHDLARKLVEEGAKRCVDEDPLTSLRLHVARIEGLVQEWYGRAFPGEGASADDEIRARENGKFLLSILGLQDRIGMWLAGLPRRGQERKETDDHAEIKAILMRAEEYGPPPGAQGTPHGLPALADWRPAEVEGESDGK
jgi:hypothetical protein